MKVYHDVFVEELVRRKHFVSELLIRIGIILLAVLLSIAAFIFLRPFSPVLTTLFILAAWLTSRYTTIEYEYSLINSELDVDRISGKRRRKRILSVNCKTANALAPESELNITRGRNKIINCSVSSRDANRWVLATTLPDGSTEYLIFSPSERLVDAIKQFMPRIKTNK